MAKNPFQQLIVLRNVSLKGHKVTDCYRLMYKKELWVKVYKKLYSSKENLASSPPNKNSIQIINEVIEQLKAGTFRFSSTPTNSKQKWNKKDKLMQEGISMILKAIYQPIFSKHLYSWKKGRNCDTALLRMKTSWKGLSWFLIGNIQPFNNQMNHSLLLQFLSNKINDRRFLLLIHNALKGGVMKDERFKENFPHKESISTLLMNIYLHEFDQLMEKQMKDCRLDKLVVSKNENNRESPQTSRQFQLKIDQNDKVYPKIKYIRFMNHFAIGILGSKQYASKFKEQVENFLKSKLVVTLTDANWGVSDLRKPIPFLGYELRKANRKDSVSSSDKPEIRVEIPFKTIRDFARKNNYGYIDDLKVTPKTGLMNHSEEDILLTYNRELRSIANKYKLANNYMCLRRLFYLAEQSFIQTIAHKRKRTKREVCRQLKNRHFINKDTHNGEHVLRFIKWTDLRKARY